MPDITEIRNPAKQRLEAGDLALGMILRVSRTGDIARIARTAGYDFLFIDIQHAIYSPETIANIAQVALGCGITAMVRTRSCRDPHIPVLLDNGVTGIVFPDVNTAEDARAGVDAARFAPIGKRSATSGYALFDYGHVSQADTISIMNRNTLVVCMIETVEGIANVEEIAAVEGVDVLLIGLTDLLTSMGKPGALGDPEAMAAIERAAAACKAHGKFFGVGGDGDLKRQAVYIEQGSRFIPTKTDATFLMTAAAATERDLRAIKK